VAQADEDWAARFIYLPRVNQSGGECARGLYQPVALLSVAVLGGSAADVGVGSTFSADTQA
jgi:hypothetical protein